MSYMKQITDKTTLAEILASPKLREVLIKYRVPCLHCPFATLEMHNLTLKQICQIYQINLPQLLLDLNKSFHNKDGDKTYFRKSNK